MPVYMVNATMTLPAWVEVEARNEQEALNIAQTDYSPREFETDPGGAELEFNVDPAVAEIPF